ncbi:uncharacterized protein [Ptychodera flava]|uniref:uncharacterized protein n=1 Tax=Ptychodera flava TaxID=63121 RepID=UPI003969BEE8
MVEKQALTQDRRMIMEKESLLKVEALAVEDLETLAILVQSLVKVKAMDVVLEVEQTQTGIPLVAVKMATQMRMVILETMVMWTELEMGISSHCQTCIWSVSPHRRFSCWHHRPVQDWVGNRWS